MPIQNENGGERRTTHNIDSECLKTMYLGKFTDSLSVTLMYNQHDPGPTWTLWRATGNWAKLAEGTISCIYVLLDRPIC